MKGLTIQLLCAVALGMPIDESDQRAAAYPTASTSHTLRQRSATDWHHFPPWTSVSQKSTPMAWGYGGHAVVSTKTVAPRQDEILSNYNRSSYWELDVTVSGRPYALFFDTGSSDLWIQDSDFVPSSTFVLDPDSNFNISYLDGSTANGPVGNDTVSFSGLTSTQQLIAVPNSVSIPMPWTRYPH